MDKAERIKICRNYHLKIQAGTHIFLIDNFYRISIPCLKQKKSPNFDDNAWENIERENQCELLE